jgi:hypothetical protein
MRLCQYCGTLKSSNLVCCTVLISPTSVDNRKDNIDERYRRLSVNYSELHARYEKLQTQYENLQSVFNRRDFCETYDDTLINTIKTVLSITDENSDAHKICKNILIKFEDNTKNG